MLRPFGEFVQDYKARDRDEFLEVVKEPHLLVPGINRLEAPDDGGSFMTLRFKPGQQAREADVLGIIGVRKRRDSNAFAMMITLGRAPNNDLVLPDQRVSKFHAYFRRVGAQWMLNDANSMNGTWVDGVQVPPERSSPLKSGARIRLAETLELEFLEPDQLFERLQSAPA